MTRISRTVSVLGFAAVAALASSCAPAGPASAPAALPELAGRTAGPAQRCVPARQSEALRIADGRTLLYGSGRTVWVNRVECAGVTAMDILVVEQAGSEYCRGDRVSTIDPVSRIPGPACILGDFVPYMR